LSDGRRRTKGNSTLRMPNPIDQPRYARWVRASHSVARFEQFLPEFIQGLGKIDAELIFQDRAFAVLPAGWKGRGSIEESLKLTDRFVLSAFWVYGIYEVIRTLDERVRSAPPRSIVYG